MYLFLITLLLQASVLDGQECIPSGSAETCAVGADCCSGYCFMDISLGIFQFLCLECQDCPVNPFTACPTDCEDEAVEPPTITPSFSPTVQPEICLAENDWCGDVNFVDQNPENHPCCQDQNSIMVCVYVPGFPFGEKCIPCEDCNSAIQNCPSCTHAPTSSPTISSPTVQPSTRPTVHPSFFPSNSPSNPPATSPSFSPSTEPTFFPSVSPTVEPSSRPSFIPSQPPISSSPSYSPSHSPTVVPTFKPSTLPSASPSKQPTVSSPTQLPSFIPSVLPTSSIPSGVPSRTPTVQPTSHPSAIPTAHPTSSTPTGIPSQTPTVVPSFNPSMIPSTHPTASNPTVMPSQPPSVIPSFKPSVIPTTSPSSSKPTTSPSTTPTVMPSLYPSVSPTASPSYKPTEEPSFNPSASPVTAPSYSPTTSRPTVGPTAYPTVEPSSVPSGTPSKQPSPLPTQTPSAVPTCVPTVIPTHLPSVVPTTTPTEIPSQQPSLIPTHSPSITPTCHPSVIPTVLPTAGPTVVPTHQPTAVPTFVPTGYPNNSPTVEPSPQPTWIPTALPTHVPTQQPTVLPTNCPSVHPSGIPTDIPTIPPTQIPTVVPTNPPSTAPTTSSPSRTPTQSPSALPTATPSVVPSAAPSYSSPTYTPSTTPTVYPSYTPTTSPSDYPSVIPTVNPTVSPSKGPSFSPSFGPSVIPSVSPSTGPTTSKPSRHPSVHPSFHPSLTPTTSAPTTSPSHFPTEPCTPDDAIHSLGSDLIQLNLDNSGLSNGNIYLSIQRPPEFNLTSIRFGGNSKNNIIQWVYGDDSQDYWIDNFDNICLYEMTGEIPWSQAYSDGFIDFEIVDNDDGTTYFKNSLEIELRQNITLEDKQLSFERIYTYTLVWILSVPKQVDFDFEVLDVYASHFQATGESLCTIEDTEELLKPVVLLEHSTAISEDEFNELKKWWAAEISLVSNYAAVVGGTVTFDSGANTDQLISDWIDLEYYLEFFESNVEYPDSPSDHVNVIDALGEGIQQYGLGANEKRILFLVTYTAPSDDPCLLKQSLDVLDIELVVFALTGRDPSFDPSIYECFDEVNILTYDSINDLFTAGIDEHLLSTSCEIDGLCNGFTFLDPVDFQGTYSGVSGTLGWDQVSGQGYLTWEESTGWTFSGYSDLIISGNPTGATSPALTVTEVDTWYIMPCGTEPAQEWSNFRAIVEGYSFCKVDDHAGFEIVPSSTESNVPTSYYTEIGTVIAANIECALSCSGSCVTVEYSDGVTFDFCPDEISCGDWVPRCDDDCNACTGYDSSGTYNFLSSADDWVSLSGVSSGSFCGYSAIIESCAIEVDNEAYQCVGWTDVRRRRELAIQTEDEPRRELGTACHGVWGPWSQCSVQCGNGLQWREYTHFSGDCPFQDKDKEFESCFIRACPEVQSLITHAAAYEPNLDGTGSTMTLHFTTVINQPWKFYPEHFEISDQHESVNHASVAATLLTDCAQSTNEECEQEWQLTYMTMGLCDVDGMHMLSMLPFDGNYAHTDPIMITLLLESYSCGWLTEDEKFGNDVIKPGTSTMDDDSHTMTVTMTVLNPSNYQAMQQQVNDLLNIVSSNLNTDVQEIASRYEISVHMSFEHTMTNNYELYEFFDVLPKSITQVLGLPSTSVTEYTLGSLTTDEKMTTNFVLTITDAEITSTIWTLLHENQLFFENNLSEDMHSKVVWLTGTVNVEQIDDMKCITTIEAPPVGTDLIDSLVDKLEHLNYEVVVHEEFGTSSNVVDVEASAVTSNITYTEEESIWRNLFIVVLVLFVIIVFLIFFKKQKRKQIRQKMKLESKLHHYDTEVEETDYEEPWNTTPALKSNLLQIQTVGRNHSTFL